jgi:hypothetical protein
LADGREIGYHFGAESIVSDAVFFGHDRGLSGDAVTAGVLAGSFAAFRRDGAFAELRIGAIGC